jgi:hypothetical protein
VEANVAERVSDERLQRLADCELHPCVQVGIDTPIDCSDVAQDALDACAELARLKAEIHEEGGWREERDLLRLRCDALEADRRALVEKAVRAGAEAFEAPRAETYMGSTAFEIDSRTSKLAEIAARVLAAHNAEKEGA